MPCRGTARSAVPQLVAAVVMGSTEESKDAMSEAPRDAESPGTSWSFTHRLGTTGQSRLTVLIVSWNSWHHLQPCLSSIGRSTFLDHDVLVIDNASGDGTPEHLAREFPAVHVVQNRENLGHTRAVNQGLIKVQSEMIMVLDADTELAENAIETMVRFLDDHPEVDLVAPRTFNTDGTIQESARNFPTAMSGLFGRQSHFTRLFPNNPFSRRYLMRAHIDAAAPFRVESIASSCMLMRKSVVSRQGTWDEGFRGYFVETDWCYRLKRSGIQIYCVPASHVVHHEGNNHKRKRDARRIWMFHAGALRFYRKNCTLGRYDPRTWFAAMALSVRAGVLIAQNALKR